MKIITSLILSILYLNTVLSQEPIFSDTFLSEYEIVLLGEQTHGDGAVFEKKLAMVKELHEKGGFNLLSFESGMYDNFKANQLYSAKKEGIKLFKQSVGTIYSDTQVFQDLLDYIETHPELKILGFDSQESNLFDQYFLNDFKKLCTNNNISISDETYLELEKTLVVRDLENYIGNKKDSIALYNRIQEIQGKIDLIPKNDLETKVIIQTFKSVFSDLDFTLKSLQKEKIHVQNPRDKQMAENFIFLKETYPNEKVIGWGASYHFANRLNEFEYTVETENYIKQGFSLADSIADHNHSELNDEIEQVKELSFAKPMGQLLKEKYGNKLFSLAFTSYEGNYLDIMHDKIFPILKAPINSIEIEFKKQGAKEKLQLLENKTGAFYASVLGYLPISANWNNVFDGIYFIEKMYPPIYSEYDSTDEKLSIQTNLSTVSGAVLDNETSEQIPYADIYYSSSNISTVSNSDGQFLVSNSKDLNSYLIFSAIGYVSDSIRVKKLQKTNTILLKKSKDDIVLNEVVVTAKFKALSPKEIIKKARKNIENNYVQTPYNQSFFFKVNFYNTKDTISGGEEALIDTFNKKGINGSNNVENAVFGEIRHLRNTHKEYDKDKRSGVWALWVVLNKDIILSKANVLYRTSAYDLTNEGKVNYEGRKVHKISFVNNSPGSYSTGYGYPAPKNSNGTIFIDTENYAVLKYEHCIERTPYESKKSKNTIKEWHKIVQSYKNANGMYFVNLLDVTTTTKVYSPENKFLNTYINVQNLVSNDIETKNVNILKRPLQDLKKGFKKNTNDPFWNDKPIEFKPKITTDEVCGSE